MYVHIICMKAFTLSRRSTRKYSPLVVVCVLSIVRKGLKSFKMEIQCNDLTHALATHSAVFKFGGLLRLLNINLIKQDKPIS